MKKIITKLKLFAYLALSFLILPKPAWAQALLPIPAKGVDKANYNMCDIANLINNVTNIALSIAGTVAAIFIVIGALQYLLAYGDEAKATAGKNTLTWAIIGLVFIIAGKFLVSLIWLHIAGAAMGATTSTIGNCP